MAVARSSSGGVANFFCDMLCTSGLWMTSRLAVVGRMAGVAIPGQSLMSMNALFIPLMDFFHLVFSVNDVR